MDFSASLKKMIASSGMTQKELAQNSGVTEAAISRYLHGTRKPTMGALLKLKNSLGCTWEELIGE